MSNAQLFLFEWGIDLREAAAVKERVANAKYAANTLRDYRCSFGCFRDWCREAGRAHLPAIPQTLIDHAAWSLAHGLRLETVYARMTAINFHHRQANLSLPFDHSVREFLRNARRALVEKPQAKLALAPQQLRKISHKLRCQNSTLDIRDRAMLLLGFASGWRSAELASLDVGDVSFVPAGLMLRLGKSKTDQQGRGRLAGIQPGRGILTCPVRALEEWLVVRGKWPGPLFVGLDSEHRILRERLHKDGLRRAVKRGLTLIGEDPRPYGGHSLRAGMATAAAAAGASQLAIMQRGGWRSIHTLLRYIRPVEAFQSNPLAGVL